MPEPKLVHHFVVQGQCSGEVGKVCDGHAKFILKGGRGVASEVHCTSFPKDGAVDMFNVAILGQSVGCSDNMIDPQGEAPVSHGIGNELPIVSDKDLEGKPSLHCHMLVPQP